MAIPVTYSIIFYVNSYFNHLLGVLKEYNNQYTVTCNMNTTDFQNSFAYCSRLYFNSHWNIRINSIQHVQLTHQCNKAQHVGLPSTFFSNIITILSNISCASLVYKLSQWKHMICVTFTRAWNKWQRTEASIRGKDAREGQKNKGNQIR